MQRRRQVDIASAEGPMFRSRTKGQWWEYERPDPVVLCRGLRGREQERFSKPGIKVHRKMGTLLLGAAGRHQSEPTGCDPLGDLLVR